MIHTHPTPISPAERKLINRRIAEGGVTYVPRGVSGLNSEQETASVNWRGGRGGQPKAQRNKLAKRRQLYRKLVDERKNGPEIATIVGVSRQCVYAALSRMRLKIKPKMFMEPGDG